MTRGYWQVLLDEESVPISVFVTPFGHFVWTKEADAAFLDWMSRLATQPVFRPPDYTLPFCLSVDASDRGPLLGATLFQLVDVVVVVIYSILWS